MGIHPPSIFEKLASFYLKNLISLGSSRPLKYHGMETNIANLCASNAVNEFKIALSILIQKTLN